MTVAEELLTKVLELPENDRGMIAREILISLDSKATRTSQEEWTAAWTAEIERRRESIRDGSSRLSSWEEVKARLLSFTKAERDQESQDR